MDQIYFLLILCNIIMGIILAKNFLNTKFENFTQVNQLLSSEILQVTIGCIGAIVGLLALVLRYRGNLIIVGDLFPATTAILGGITLFIEYIAGEDSTESSIIKFIKNIFLKNRTILGFVAIAAGIIHFIAPSLQPF